MAKAKALTPAERIAAIKQQDANARTERLELDAITLPEVIAAATAAAEAVEQMEAALGQVVSDAALPGLTAMASGNLSKTIRSIVTVAEASLNAVSVALAPAEGA